ncbi:MAG: ATP-binding protein [Saccharospirillum sp.]
MTRFLAVVTALIALLLTPNAALANNQQGVWLERDARWQPAAIESDTLAQAQADRPGVSLSGGQFWHALNVTLDQDQQTVIDFRHSSVIGRFKHWVFAADGTLLAQFEGGIQSTEPNPFFLRHGRSLALAAGEYQIISQLSGPFFLAQPEPVLYEYTHYQQSIKVGNTVTLLGLGVFFALGIYYVILGTSRSRAGDLFYAGFILGNFLYNGTALLFFSDVLHAHRFYLISFPILLSNMAYIAFVMVLLNINRNTSSLLYYAGLGIITLFGGFFILACFAPNLSLELCRIGVAFFSLYGFVAGITRIVQGNRTARFYIIANIAFVIPALISIQASRLPFGDTLFIEHIALFAVAVEVILLSLVISHQVGVVYREKEAGLLATQEALLAANQALASKERFLANVSHELRTPLNAIQGSVELIGQYPLPNKVNQHIDAIHASSNFLLYLINDILDLAKMNADQLQLVSEPFDLDQTIDDLISIYKNVYDREKIQFLVEMEADLPSRILGDENRLKQVLANLLSNAFKFTERGVVNLSIQKVSDQEIRFSVSDSGIGISADKLHTVFSAFTQADASIARKYGGTGLGLQIASKLVRMMGGHLGVTSEPDQGSDFHFRLPMRTVQASAVQAAQQSVGLICDDGVKAALAQEDLKHFGIGIATVMHPNDLAETALPAEINHWLILTDTHHKGILTRFTPEQNYAWFVNYLNIQQAEDWQGSDLELLPYARCSLPRLFARQALTQDDRFDPSLTKNCSVIAVDDNAINLKVLMGMLNRLNVDCEGFDDPEEALAHITTRSPDLVLMDVQMPKLDGLDATRILRQNHYTKPIIAFTANASEQDMIACRHAGMDDILIKPIRLDELRIKLNQWVIDTTIERLPSRSDAE